MANTKIVQNVDAIQRVNVGSDHRLVRGTITLNTRLETNKLMRPRKPKVNIVALMQKKEEFQLKLENHFKILSSIEVKEMSNTITEAIQRCALETAGKNANNKEEKVKLKTKELIKKRREMTAKDQNVRAKIEYSELYKTIRKRTRDDETMRVKKAIESGKDGRKQPTASKALTF